MRKKVRSRLLVAGLGLVFAVALLEVVLRLVGVAHVHGTDQTGQAGGGRRTVLCAGDSFTEGLGAEDEESYPARLGPLLRKRGVEARVVNRGRAGANSAQVLARLPEQLERQRPGLVTLMAGASNYWNLWGHGLSFDHQQRSSPARDLLYRVRVVRLAVLLFHHVTGRRPAPDQEPDAERQQPGLSTACTRHSAWFYPVPVPGLSGGGPRGSSGGALLGQISARISASPDQGHLYCAKALVQARMGAPTAAVSTLKQGLKQSPKNSDLYYLLGAIYAGVIADMSRGGPGWSQALEKARRWHERGIEADPKNGHNYHGQGEIFVLQTARGEDMDPAFNARMFKKALSWFSRGMEADPDNAAAGRARIRFVKKYMEGAADEYAWIRSDLAAMIKLVRARGVPLLLQTYPNNSNNKAHIKRAIHNANRAMKGLAAAHGLPLVDHHQRFQKLMDTGTREQSLYASDVEHPNKGGYRVMAEGLAERIVELELLGRN